MKEYKLTEYSHGAGCGCKISPKQLTEILKGVESGLEFPDLIVGNSMRDDAAVISFDEENHIISTTDFFMPIVDDPYDFGRIAGANAISDIYAMGGKPLMAISIFGWPVNKLPNYIAQKVLEGGKNICNEAGIPLAGGHSIDSPEPIFGLAVTGSVKKNQLKQNSGAKPGDRLILTKPLGIGILSTAQKQKKLRDEHRNIARDWMVKLNSVGSDLGAISGVNALTDVTGFGLLGHLHEICSASGVHAVIEREKVPFLDNVEYYLDQGCTPGGTGRNWESYGSYVRGVGERERYLLADPQTSGGLLISANEKALGEVENVFKAKNHFFAEVGYIKSGESGTIYVE